MKSGETVYLSEPPEGPICDFCSDSPIYADYPARDFNVSQLPKPDGSKLNINSESDWAACKTCAGLIDANNWDALLDRSVETFRKKYGHRLPVAEARRSIAELHRKFRENRQPTH
jgi:hypothetical protein